MPGYDPIEQSIMQTMIIASSCMLECFSNSRQSFAGWIRYARITEGPIILGGWLGLARNVLESCGYVPCTHCETGELRTLNGLEVVRLDEFQFILGAFWFRGLYDVQFKVENRWSEEETLSSVFDLSVLSPTTCQLL